MPADLSATTADTARMQFSAGSANVKPRWLVPEAVLCCTASAVEVMGTSSSRLHDVAPMAPPPSCEKLAVLLWVETPSGPSALILPSPIG